MTEASLKLPQAMVDAMVEHAQDDLPNECCGLIVGKDGVATKLYRTRNAEASPFRYAIDPLEYMKIERENDATGAEVMVVYHSHVASDAYPSPTDVRLSQWPGVEPPLEIFPGAYYVLVSLKDRDAPVVRAYLIHAGEVSEVGLEAV